MRIEEEIYFSNISANKLKLEEVDFNLDDVLENARSLFEQRINDKGLTCTHHIDPDLPICLRGDPLRLGQVLINYIGNAIRFTEKGHIIVRIQKMDENEQGVLLRFEVQDNGIGITEDAKSLLFQAFQQADSSTTRVFGGTGFGLSICRQLVEQMQEGKVGVDSTPKKGSIFWFSARLLKISVPQVQKSIADLPSSPLLYGLHILVADDHPLNCEVATGFLENAGALVSIAYNGQEALERLNGQRFDCLLLDIQMPFMDGFEAIRLIRADPALADMPVIAMTASTSTEEHRSYLAAGMNDFIGKPFYPAVLYATLAKWLRVPQQPIPAEIPAMDVETPDIIDLPKMVKWIGDDKIELQRFTLNFVKSTRLDMIKIDVALEDGDFAALASLAHYVSSPARMVGAIGFVNLCQALEKHGKAGEDVKQVQVIISQMHTQLDLIEEFINNSLCRHSLESGKTRLKAEV